MKPLDLPNFETQARTLRYQALGTACRDHGCDYLMVGHHKDDHAETVMMRLASGHSSRGILGIRPHTDLPECWGIHGVHRSGLCEAKSSRLKMIKRELEQTHDPRFTRLKMIKRELEQTHDPRFKSRLLDDTAPKDFIFERGGIKLLRPLMTFSKKRLMATCGANAMKWDEDSTNREPWRTPRNAIRELFQSSKLPVALRKDSMLELSNRTRKCIGSQMSIAESELNQCDVSVFDLRSGRLVVRFPNRALPEDGACSHTFKPELRVSTAFLLRELAYAVSPLEDITFGSMKPAVMSIYPELFDSDIGENPIHHPTSFTTGGVHFQRLLWPLSQQRVEPRPSDFRKPNPGTERLNPDFVWQLTRQPLSTELPSFTIPPSRMNSSLLSDSDSIPPNTYPISSTSLWSPWRLWDGRYWIRVLNRSNQHLVVRPLQQSDLRVIDAMIGRDRHKALRKLLAAAAPDKIRWTLPAIAQVDDSQPNLSRVLALPTLGSCGHLALEDEQGHKSVEWQIRYKKPYRGLRYDRGSDILRPLKLGRNLVYMPSWND